MRHNTKRNDEQKSSKKITSHSYHSKVDLGISLGHFLKWYPMENCSTEWLCKEWMSSHKTLNGMWCLKAFLLFHLLFLLFYFFIYFIYLSHTADQVWSMQERAIQFKILLHTYTSAAVYIHCRTKFMYIKNSWKTRDKYRQRSRLKQQEKGIVSSRRVEHRGIMGQSIPIRDSSREKWILVNVSACKYRCNATTMFMTWRPGCVLCYVIWCMQSWSGKV